MMELRSCWVLLLALVSSGLQRGDTSSARRLEAACLPCPSVHKLLRLVERPGRKHDAAPSHPTAVIVDARSRCFGDHDCLEALISCVGALDLLFPSLHACSTPMVPSSRCIIAQNDPSTLPICLRDFSSREVSRLARDFVSKGVVRIPNVIQNIANLKTMYRLLASDPAKLHKGFWVVSGTIDSTTGFPASTPYSNMSLQEQRQTIELQKTRKEQGEYAMFFLRSDPESGAALRCCYRDLFEDMISVLDGGRLRTVLHEVTGQRLRLSSFFISRYHRDHFLSRHQDLRDDRFVAFTLHLTPDWKQEHGGLLLLHDVADELKIQIPA